MGTGSSGTNYTMGQNGGVESVTLTTQQIPSHTHPFIVSGDSGSQSNPGGAVPATGVTIYRAAQPANVPMNANAVTQAGGNQPHDNMQPFLCINYIISLYGVYPSPT